MPFDRLPFSRTRSLRSALAIFVGLSIVACGGRGGGNALVPDATHSQPIPTSSTAPNVGTFAETLATKQMTDAGPSAAGQAVHLVVTLSHRDENGLQQLIRDQGTPGSSSYKQFLTPAQFDARFGASLMTRTRVKAALARAGFSVTPDRFGASTIEADSTVASAAKSFGTSFRNVRERNGRIAMLPATVPVIPPDIQADTTSVVGLDTTDVTPPRDQTVPSACPLSAKRIAVSGGANPAVVCCSDSCPTPPPRPTIQPSSTPGPTPTPTPPPGSNYPASGPNVPVTTGPGYPDDTSYNGYVSGYAPYTYAQDFDLPVQHGFGGSSQFSIGILVDGDVSDNDLQLYYSYMGVNRTGNLIRSGTPGSGVFEATLDVETVSGLAPAADVYLYRMPDNAANTIVSSMNAAVTANTVAVLNMSFGGCEKASYPSLYEVASAEDSAAAQASAQGITMVASTGDDGGPSSLSGCASINAPAASSYVVAVGGTSPYNGTGPTPPYAYRQDPAGPGWQSAWGQTVAGAGSPCGTGGFCGSNGGGFYALPNQRAVERLRRALALYSGHIARSGR